MTRRRDPLAPTGALRLEGVRNFRDLGGLPYPRCRAAVRWRCLSLFRVAWFADARRPRDPGWSLAGLRAVFDLRATDERAKEPVRWTGSLAAARPRLPAH